MVTGGGSGGLRRLPEGALLPGEGTALVDGPSGRTVQGIAQPGSSIRARLGAPGRGGALQPPGKGTDARGESRRPARARAQSRSSRGLRCSRPRPDLLGLGLGRRGEVVSPRAGAQSRLFRRALPVLTPARGPRPIRRGGRRVQQGAQARSSLAERRPLPRAHLLFRAPVR